MDPNDSESSQHGNTFISLIPINLKGDSEAHLTLGVNGEYPVDGNELGKGDHWKKVELNKADCIISCAKLKNKTLVSNSFKFPR